MEELESQTLFNAQDAIDALSTKNLIKSDNPDINLCQSPSKAKTQILQNSRSDANERKQNFGPALKSDSSSFGNFIPQTVDNLQADNCIHDICYPPNWDIENARKELSTPLGTREPAKTYKFTLDSFQKRAINCIERNHNVLVAAHTSAGKTTVAEYAIAKSIQAKTRVIYTSPIKALSNQKYRDLYEEFQDVGLLTGDVTINPTASCLVMTTEILRNMLYRGSEVIREVSWVIFDEIHYMRNKTRGVVYEECLILLPEITKFVFLSATIPNATEFACWIAKLNKSPCNVVYTEKRPVPLHHFVSPKGGNGLTLVMDEKKYFKESKFLEAINSIKIDDNRNQQNRKRKNIAGEEDLFRVMKLIMSKRDYPAIIFAFSRRDCETNALLMSKLNFNSENEKNTIEQIFNNAIDSLSSDDKKLPQIRSILPILKRGIGIHHSGLLPILKEVIEILFQEGLIKCLFATETFAMGINMPAKTVVFTNLRKFDGIDTRYLSSGEYIQMSGRSGRRGVDKMGKIIIMLSQRIEPSVAIKILKGQADSLNSSFVLGYNMLLNLMRVEGSDPEYMISHSFRQFQAAAKTPLLREKLLSTRKLADEIMIEEEEQVKELYTMKINYKSINEKVKITRNRSENILPFLNPGRLVKITYGDNDWGWGAVVNFEKTSNFDLPAKGIFGKDKNNSRFFYLVYVYIKYESRLQTNEILPSSHKNWGSEIVKSTAENNNSITDVIPCTLATLDQISTVRVYMPRDTRSPKGQKKLNDSLVQVFKTYTEESLPVLDPIKDMKISGKSFSKAVKRLNSARKEYNDSTSLSKPRVIESLEKYKQKMVLEDEIATLEKSLSDIQFNKGIKSTLKKMKRVLFKSNCITKDNVVNIKGRVACDISTAHELLTTELLYSGCFSDLSPRLIAALASCLVSCDRNKDVVKIKNELAEPYFKLQDAAKKVAAVIKGEGIEIDTDEFEESFKPSLMEVVYDWAGGNVTFGDICKKTTVFEGSIIRVIRRLGELLGELAMAAQVLGNEDLKSKFEESAKLIKRDIVFAASLYL